MGSFAGIQRALSSRTFNQTSTSTDQPNDQPHHHHHPYDMTCRVSHTCCRAHLEATLFGCLQYIVFCKFTKGWSEIA